jgi:hypothetical protein
MVLGGYRPGVTVALSLLEKEGLIHANRGVITIIGRKGVENNCNGALRCLRSGVSPLIWSAALRLSRRRRVSLMTRQLYALAKI